jgi:hypothetical protein
MSQQIPCPPSSSATTAATRRIVLFIALLVLVSGCGSDPHDPMQRYLVELQAATDSRSVLEPARRPSYPDRGQRLHEIEDQRVGLRGWIDLSACGFDRLVATRNSGLGRVMAASQHLLYEQEVLRAAHKCLLDETLTEAQRASLAGLIEQKRVARDHLLFNATLGGEEMDRFFSGRERLPELSRQDLERLLAPSERAFSLLESFVKRFDAGDSVSSEELEGALETFYRDPVGGPVTQALFETERSLDHGSDLLDRVEQEGPALAPGEKRCEALETVFRGVWATEVRSRGIELNQGSAAWFEAFSDLRGALSTREPEGFSSSDFARTFFARAESQRGFLDAALERHARAWQGVLEPCEIRIGAGP